MSRVSIVIPVYNVKNYLDKCMQSIINQTLKSIEIICVNDGSTDNSLDILKKYEKLDNRIIIVNQKNSGLSEARNSGLKKATSPYILFVDSDDWLELNACEVLYKAITSNDCDIVQAKVSLRYTGNYQPNSSDELYFNSRANALIHINQNTLLISNSSSCSKLFKKEIIDTYKINFPKGLHYEDAPFVWKYLSVSKNILFIDDKFYNYLRRPQSIMANTYAKNSLISLDHIRIFYDYYTFLQNWEIFTQFEVIFWTLFEDFFWKAFYSLSSTNQHLSFKLATEFLIDKEIKSLKGRIDNRVYKILQNLKNKNYNKVYTLKNKNIFSRFISLLYTRKYRKETITTKFFKITVQTKPR